MRTAHFSRQLGAVCQGKLRKKPPRNPHPSPHVSSRQTYGKIKPYIFPLGRQHGFLHERARASPLCETGGADSTKCRVPLVKLTPTARQKRKSCVALVKWPWCTPTQSDSTTTQPDYTKATEMCIAGTGERAAGPKLTEPEKRSFGASCDLPAEIRFRHDGAATAGTEKPEAREDRPAFLIGAPTIAGRAWIGFGAARRGLNHQGLCSHCRK